MKPAQKEKIRRSWRAFLRFTAVHLILPLFFCALAVLFAAMKKTSPADVAALAESLLEKRLFAVAGAVPINAGIQVDYYFLSSELCPPTGTVKPAFGTARYFSPEKEKSPANEKPHPKKTYDALPANAKSIIACDLSSDAVINSTGYAVDLAEVRNTPYPVKTGAIGTEPVVLVLHTHATEGYFADETNLSDFAPAGVETYIPEEDIRYRTDDPERSVVKVGAVFCEELEKRGIPTLHCEVMHDKEDFNTAYTRSAETVQKLLRENPSIRYVIDLHRDSVVRGESFVKTLASPGGAPTAQVMLVVGTNQLGNHPNWRQNLAVACAYKDKMDTLSPSLSRSLYLRTARFNQEYLPGCMLLEVGSWANTLEEAESAAVLAARSLADLIKENA